MRGRVAWLVICCGCYHPSAATNVPCSSNGDCPGSQICNLDLPTPVCVVSLPDASLIDGASTGASCSRDSDCDSTVCAETDGKCVDADETLFVATDGDDSNDCSKDHPCASISHAVDQLDLRHDTIRVAKGAYTDAFVIDANTDVLISGEVPDYAGTDITFLASRGHAHTVEALDTDIRIEGISIHGGNSETVRSDSDLSLHHVAVLDSSTGGIDCNGCTLHLVDSLVANHTAIGVDVRGGGNASIHRSKVTGCTGGGVRVTNTSFDISSSFLVHDGSAAGGPAFAIVNDTVLDPARFAFNTLAGNASGGVSCSVATTVSSSIFSGNNGPLTAMCTAQYSLFEGSTIPGVGNLSLTDPMFIDDSNGDYHIQSGSPAIDHADPAEQEDTDYDGDPRPRGAASDIGADEHG